MLTFLGIGAQKTATSWLDKMLRGHPQVGLPAKKELHFWDTQELTFEAIRAYASIFEAMPTKVNGEITPGYAILSPVVIRLIHQHFPHLKLFYILRNPLERAWSHAKMHVPQYKGPEYIADLDRVEDAWFIEHFHSEKSLLRGDYETCIRNWRGVFPAEQLALYLYDDLLRDQATFLSRCCMHLGVDPGFHAQYGVAELQAKYETSGHEAIRPSLVPVLHEIYAPKIRSLSEYLRIDLMRLWLGP